MVFSELTHHVTLQSLSTLDGLHVEESNLSAHELSDLLPVLNYCLPGFNPATLQLFLWVSFELRLDSRSSLQNGVG